MHAKVLEERMERVLEELEAQRKLVKSQQIEIELVKGEMSRVDVEYSKLTLEVFKQSTSMFMTLKLIVKHHNNYICFGYYGRVVTDT